MNMSNFKVELKKVVDVTYNDLYTATKVDDALKEKLRE